MKTVSKKSIAWNCIMEYLNWKNHDFSKSPLYVSNFDIKMATKDLETTSQKEVRILTKHDSRDDRPDIFIENNLFILPIKNGEYYIIQGEGYVDIPSINQVPIKYYSQLKFVLASSKVGDSEMQHLDFAYASSLIRTFMNDESLVLTIRGRKYTPEFSFTAGTFKQIINTKSVQTEVDAGYEGKSNIVLIEAKNSKTTNTIIRQLYYPYRQWSELGKKVSILFFEKQKNMESTYNIWEYQFTNINDYNSIKLIRSSKYVIV